MENNRSNLILGIAIGAAAGLVVGYLLNGKKLEEVAIDMSNAAHKIMNTVSDIAEKANETIQTVRNNANEFKS